MKRIAVGLVAVSFTFAQGVEFVPASTEQQARFDQLYQQDAARNAAALSRYDISGLETLTLARQIADGIRRTGSVSCTVN